MQDYYDVSVRITRSFRRSAVKELLSRFPELEILNNDDLGALVRSSDPRHARRFYVEAQKSGAPCAMTIMTRYGYDDALKGELGLLHAASDNTALFAAPKDGFDFSAACPRCGMGAAQVKPYALRAAARNYRRGNFLVASESERILMRAEIGREIVEATGQPWCMRHPVDRSGQIIEEWMEPVPCATMPPLSRKSEGLMWGKSWALVKETGDPPDTIESCPVCVRTARGISNEEPVRLVYPRAAIEAAQKHAVVAMYEPDEGFPAFDPVNRTYEHLYGLPPLLFNHAAIKVLMKYMQTEHIRDSAWIQPVFSE